MTIADTAFEIANRFLDSGAKRNELELAILRHMEHHVKLAREASDGAAYALLEKIAQKAVEPMSDDADPKKTLGQCRDELLVLIQDAVSFVMARNANK